MDTSFLGGMALQGQGRSGLPSPSHSTTTCWCASGHPPTIPPYSAQPTQDHAADDQTMPW